MPCGVPINALKNSDVVSGNNYVSGNFHTLSVKRVIIQYYNQIYKKYGMKLKDNEDSKSIRTMINLIDFGITISVFSIASVDKKERFIETPTPRWQFGIVINDAMEPSSRYPRTNIESWYEKEETRDERYNDIIYSLEEFGFKVIDI